MNHADPQYRTIHGRLRSVKGRTVFSTLIVLLIISILLFHAVERYMISVRGARETALSIELSNLRTAVNFFVIAKRRLPLSTRELVREKVVLTEHVIEGKDYYLVIASSYVEKMSRDPEGYPTDVFGNRFSYDPGAGRIWSSTKGYEGW